MHDKRGTFIRAAYILVAIVAAILITRVVIKNRTITIHGAVVRQSDEPNRETPLASVQVRATDGTVIANSTSDASGSFAITLRRALISRHSVTLTFLHKDYKPYSIFDPAGNKLYVVRMDPVQPPAPVNPDDPMIHVSGVSVRYTVKTEATVEIGSGVKTFEVVNKANVPCDDHKPCSPDGKWKAALGSVTLDAGPDNEFRNGRISCIAGPCPFTEVMRDDFSRGGRTIGAAVLNWSDTVTYLLQAEAVRRITTDSTRKSYPVIVDHTMNFSLPASAEGTCIEADIDGQPIVFPIGPNPWFSWANCETQPEPANNLLYRCELKPGYVFR
jgi:hypothetical protein